MNENELFLHFEKLYFHELNRKEQIFSRLNISLAVIIAIAGFYSVIIGGDRASLSLGTKIWFLSILGLSLMLLCIGAAFFIDALLGRIDENIPTPNTIEKYRLDLLSHYSSSTDRDQIIASQIKKMYYEYYMNCATICTINNDRKTSSLYYCNVLLIASAAFAITAYAVITLPKL